MMADWIFPFMFLVMFLLCVIGTVYFFYRAIRLFIVWKIWSGAIRLFLSLLLGFIVVSVIAVVIEAREKAIRCSCHSHLNNIVLMLKMYANDHEEEYPATLNDMVATNYLRTGDAAILVCPASHTKTGGLNNIHSWSDYAYVSGLTEGDPANCVMVFCSPENHKGVGASVAFIGGQVRWFSCHSYTNAPLAYQPTFQELTNNPSLFYGTTNETQLADLMKRTRIIYPHQHK